MRDNAERVGRTFIQGALGAVPAEALATGDVTMLPAAELGDTAAVLSLVKAIAARHVGDPQTASALRGFTSSQLPGQAPADGRPPGRHWHPRRGRF